MADREENYEGLEIRTGFINRKEYGFRDFGEGVGVHIYGLKEMHGQYLGGVLSDREMNVADTHLLECRRCENHWDALTSKLEDSSALDRPENTPDDDEEIK